MTEKTADQLERKIESLIPKAESGEQWAEICRLEAEMIARRCAEPGVTELVITSSSWEVDL